jgi:hypothetical protein
MSDAASVIPSSTRPVSPELSALLRSLRPGDRIRITQKVRVGLEAWDTTVTGTFRSMNFLCTGLATQRVRADDIVVVAVHFTKDSPPGELSSITLDEHSRIEQLGS